MLVFVAVDMCTVCGVKAAKQIQRAFRERMAQKQVVRERAAVRLNQKAVRTQQPQVRA